MKKILRITLGFLAIVSMFVFCKYRDNREKEMNIDPATAPFVNQYKTVTKAIVYYKDGTRKTLFIYSQDIPYVKNGKLMVHYYNTVIDTNVEQIQILK